MPLCVSVKSRPPFASAMRVNCSRFLPCEIAWEGLRSGNIAETCRRYGIAPNLYYRWKDEAELGARAALGGKSAAGCRCSDSQHSLLCEMLAQCGKMSYSVKPCHGKRAKPARIKNHYRLSQLPFTNRGVLLSVCSAYFGRIKLYRAAQRVSQRGDSVLERTVSSGIFCSVLGPRQIGH